MNFAMRSLLLATVVALGVTHARATPRVSLASGSFEGPGVGDNVVVAVAASQADGVTSMDLNYAFDASVLTPTGVFLTEYGDGFSLSFSFATPGIVELHLERPVALAGSGDIAWVVFRVASAVPAGTTTPLTWVSARLNGGALPCEEEGMNLAIGTTAATIATPRQAFGVHGSRVLVPITASSLAGGSAFDLVVTFDPRVLAAVSVQKTGMTSCMASFHNTSIPGKVQISLFGLCSISGSGSLANILFDVIGPTGSRTPLNVTRGDVDEQHFPTVLDDGLFNVCKFPDGDGDGYSVCAGDCNDANAARHPGAVEACNGIDDDCDGLVDDAVAPKSVPAIALAKDYQGTRLSWPPVFSATYYDVVRGRLAALRNPSGGFSGATDLCLANDSAASTVLDGSVSTEGDGFWYLMRAGNCGGPGTFDGGGTGQASPRDPGINAASSSCP